MTRVPIADASAVDGAIGRAHRAAREWAAMPAAERASCLSAAAKAVGEAAEELAELNERETGKVHDDALGGVGAGVGTLVQYTELGPLHRGRSLHGAWSATDLMVPEPRGVVAVLTPWNDPVAVAAGLLGAALVTGNTVVHKPSERCPSTGRRFAEIIAAHLPGGVLEIVDGDGAVGALVDEAHRWADRIGPLVDERHRAHVHMHVTDTVENGARLLIGGERPSGPGSFYPPTVLAECTPDLLASREETFGPIAPVRVVPDFETALTEAASDRYGLAATVLTADMRRAQTAWRTLPVGTVKINGVFGGAPGGASEPRRASGSGFGFGPELLDEMTAIKVVHWSPPAK